MPTSLAPSQNLGQDKSAVLEPERAARRLVDCGLWTGL